MNTRRPRIQTDLLSNAFDPDTAVTIILSAYSDLHDPNTVDNTRALVEVWRKRHGFTWIVRFTMRPYTPLERVIIVTDKAASRSEAITLAMQYAGGTLDAALRITSDRIDRGEQPLDLVER